MTPRPGSNGLAVTGFHWDLDSEWPVASSRLTITGTPAKRGARRTVEGASGSRAGRRRGVAVELPIEVRPLQVDACSPPASGPRVDYGSDPPRVPTHSAILKGGRAWGKRPNSAMSLSRSPLSINAHSTSNPTFPRSGPGFSVILQPLDQFAEAPRPRCLPNVVLVGGQAQLVDLARCSRPVSTS